MKYKLVERCQTFDKIVSFAIPITEFQDRDRPAIFWPKQMAIPDRKKKIADRHRDQKIKT